MKITAFEFCIQSIKSRPFNHEFRSRNFDQEWNMAIYLRKLAKQHETEKLCRTNYTV